MRKRATDLGAKQQTDAQGPVRYKLCVSLILTFGKQGVIRPPNHGQRGSLRYCARTSSAGPGYCNLGSFRSVTAQLASPIVCFAGLGRCPPLGCRYGTGKRKLKRQFTGLSPWTYRQAGKQLERLAKVCSGLGHRRTLDRQAPSRVPILDCLFNEASHRTMLRHKLGLSRCSLGNWRSSVVTVRPCNCCRRLRSKVL